MSNKNARAIYVVFFFYCAHAALQEQRDHVPTSYSARTCLWALLECAVLQIHDIFATDPDPDPCLWLIDPDSDPDPIIFVINLQDANKKQ
jgi:hypothetical protein